MTDSLKQIKYCDMTYLGAMKGRALLRNFDTDVAYKDGVQFFEGGETQLETVELKSLKKNKTKYTMDPGKYFLMKTNK